MIKKRIAPVVALVCSLIAVAMPCAMARAQPDPNRVTIRLREIEQMEDQGGTGYLDRYATFSATTVVQRILPRLSEGTGTGTFVENARLVVYDWCERRISSSIQAQMRVRFQHDLREVNVTIAADGLSPNDRLYERIPEQPQCGYNGGYTGTQSGPRLGLSCIFTNVDFERGGVYRDESLEDYTDDDERRLGFCEMTIGGPPPPEEDPPPPPPLRSPRARSHATSSTGGAAPFPPVAGAPAGGAPPSAPGAPGAPGATTQDPPQTARYRAVLAGVRAVAATRDGADADGRGDELYVAAASFSWDRLAGRASGFQLKRTREYGDTGIANAEQRVRAGGAGPTGGVAAGDVVPSGFAPGAAVTAAASDQLPLLVWEGPLTVGADALVIAPTLWERDTRSRTFDAYRLGWLTAAVPGLMAQPELAAELARPVLAVVHAPEPSAEQAAALVARGAGGRYVAASGQALAEGGDDRPIGIGTFSAAAAIYAERYVVVTREKLAALAVGGAATLAVPLVDSAQLGGNYELYLRFERTQ